jgi:hypothetical protein
MCFSSKLAHKELQVKQVLQIMEIIQVFIGGSLAVVISLLEVHYSALFFDMDIDLLSVHLVHFWNFRHNLSLVVVIPELMLEEGVLASDIADLIFEVFNQIIHFSEVVVVVRASSSFSSGFQDLIEERNSPEIFNLTGTFIIKDIFLFSFFFSSLNLIKGSSRLSVIMEELMLTFLRRKDCVDHVVFGEQVSSAAHGVGLMHELHLQRILTDNTVNFLTEIMG